MESVKVSKKGITKNVLSLNYDEITTIIEYINNVISKNNDDDYRITFDMKEVCGRYIFTFQDHNSVGFLDELEIERAFSIADSKRSDTNNMGYGIFSPLTIHKKHHSLGLFLQKKETESLFAIALFIPDQEDCLQTQTGTYEDSILLGVNVSELEVEFGTQCIWVSGTTVGLTDDCEPRESREIIKFVKGTYKKSQTPQAKNLLSDDLTNDNQLYAKCLSLGKTYYDHLQTKQISFNDVAIKPIDFLGYGLDKSRKLVFHVESLLVEQKEVYRIRQEGDDTWRKLNKTGIGEEWSSNRISRSNMIQSCKIRIHCLPRPQDRQHITEDSAYWETLDRKEMRTERKIYTKLGNTIIFDEEYSKHGCDEIRVIIDLNNNKDNQMERFISPNANKSNSKINSEFKSRVVSVVNVVTGKNKYFGKFLHIKKDKVKKADRRLVWENTNGKIYEAPCFIKRCNQILCCMGDWHAGHNKARVDGGSNSIENIRPICAECNASMGTMSIDDYNEMYDSDE